MKKDNIEFKCSNCTFFGKTKVLGTGPKDAEIMFIGEGPGEEEEIQGIPFVGRSGKFLTDILNKVGIDRNKCYITNAILCRPPGNRTPTKEEVLCCRQRLVRCINRIKPKLIVTLGNVAYFAIFPSGRIGGISECRSVIRDSKEFDCKVLSTYHPAAVLRDPLKYKDFEKDIQKIKMFLSGEKIEVEHTYILLDSVDKIRNAFKELKESIYVSMDIEAEGLDYFTDKIISFAFSHKLYTSYFIPTPYSPFNCFTEDVWNKEVIPLLKELLEDPNIRIIVHNESYETLFMKGNLNIDLQVYFDTLLAHHLLDENSQHGLKRLSIRYPDIAGYEVGINRGKIYELPPEELMKYNCIDADVTFRLYLEFKDELRKEELDNLFFNLVMPLRRVLSKMEYRGIRIDIPYLNKLEQEWNQQLKEIENKIFELVGKELNIHSTKQLSTLLFNDLKLPIINHTAKGNPSTNDATLQELTKYSEIPKLLLKYRKISKMLSTYVTGLKERINKVTNKVHTDYLVYGTHTGRLSSRDPNLQNIPRGDDEFGLAVKRAFVPLPDWLMVSMDYSQLEYRIMLNYAQDYDIIKEVSEGKDIHRVIASEVFKKPMDQITDKERVIAKTIVFGLIYGRGPRSLAETLNISLTEAYKFIDSFFKKHKKIKDWMDKQCEIVKKEKKVKSLFGRIRRLYSIDSIDQGIAAKAERQAINFPIQSTASDITSSTLVRLWNRFIEEGYQARPILIIHDSITCECPKEEVERVKEIMVEEATQKQFPGINIPLEVKVKVLLNWADEIKEMK